MFGTSALENRIEIRAGLIRSSFVLTVTYTTKVEKKHLKINKE